MGLQPLRRKHRLSVDREVVGGGGATESFSRQVILVTWQAKWGFVQ